MIEFGEIARGGKEFRPTSPLAMEQAIRSAVEARAKQRKGFAIIPYTRKFGEDEFYLLIRREKTYGSGRYGLFSLDVGKFDPDFRWFYSIGMADFSIVPSKGRKRVGHMNMIHRSFDPEEFFVQRTWEMEDAMDGLYVDNAFRANGIGKSLITGARVILNELGVEELKFDHALTTLYEKLGGKQKADERSDVVYIPTANTPEAPYVFA